MSGKSTKPYSFKPYKLKNTSLFQSVSIGLLTITLVLTYLVMVPPKSATRLSPGLSYIDYIIVVGLWVLIVLIVWLIYHQSGGFNPSQLLSVLTSGLSSSSLATTILGVLPEFTGQPLTYSQQLLYTLPVQLAATALLFYIKNKSQPSPATVTINNQ